MTSKVPNRRSFLEHHTEVIRSTVQTSADGPTSYMGE
jgi:hypothetical protein